MMFRYDGAYDDHYQPIGRLCDHIGHCVICGNVAYKAVLCDAHDGLAGLHAKLLTNERSEWFLPKSDQERRQLPTYTEWQTSANRKAPFTWRWMVAHLFHQRKNTTESDDTAAA